MKRILILLLALALILTGCGKQTEPTVTPNSGTETPTATSQPAGTTEPANTITTETTQPGTEAAQPATTEPDPVTEGDPGVTADQDMQAYGAFLGGAEPCIFAKDALGDGSTGDEYEINKLIMATSSHFAAEDLSAYFHSARYAFIDCGDDGEPELALEINLMPTEDSEYYDLTQYFIFKYMGGRVQLVGSNWGYYRSWVELNEYGVFNYVGSNGAASYYMDISFVDKNGEEQFVHGVNVEMGMAEPGVSYYYIPDSIRPADYPYIEMSGSDSDYYIMEAYNFEKYGPDTDYDAYQMNSLYRFTDADGRDAEPSDELKAVYEELGIKWYDTDAMDKIMDDHLASLGVDEAMMEMSYEPEWQELDLE